MIQTEKISDVQNVFELSVGISIDFMQWAGTHYIMSRMEEEHSDELIKGECYDEETLYWIGYIYRYWHFYTNEKSHDILRQASVKTMRVVYLMYHTMSPEMAIDRLKESYLEKRKCK